HGPGAVSKVRPPSADRASSSCSSRVPATVPSSQTARPFAARSRIGPPGVNGRVDALHVSAETGERRSRYPVQRSSEQRAVVAYAYPPVVVNASTSPIASWRQVVPPSCVAKKGPPGLETYANAFRLSARRRLGSVVVTGKAGAAAVVKLRPPLSVRTIA